MTINLFLRVVPECMLEPRRSGKKRRHPIHKKKSAAQNEEEESVDDAKSRKVNVPCCQNSGDSQILPKLILINISWVRP